MPSENAIVKSYIKILKTEESRYGDCTLGEEPGNRGAPYHLDRGIYLSHFGYSAKRGGGRKVTVRRP